MNSSQIIAKPTGSICNLKCHYCYYLDKKNLYSANNQGWVMNDQILEAFIEQYIDLYNEPVIPFIWHGGEPMLCGMDFFKKVLVLQKKYGKQRTIENSIQTNGTILTDDWCRFFKDNNFLIGFSIDGPEHCHDHYRFFKNGNPSFSKSMSGLDLIKKHGLNFNTLTVVNDYNSNYPLEVYRFLKNIGSQFIQFIPVVEQINPTSLLNRSLVKSVKSETVNQIAKWSVDSVMYGKFLIEIFNEWVRFDVGSVYIITFENILSRWFGGGTTTCLYSETCGQTPVVEFNGDIYSCDHYVFPEYKLGNLLGSSLNSLLQSPFQVQFGQKKRTTLPSSCLQCRFLKICNGECPKNRFLYSPYGEPGLNYLCNGFQLFYDHIAPYMDFMVNELSLHRSPSIVKTWARKQSMTLIAKQKA